APRPARVQLGPQPGCLLSRDPLGQGAGLEFDLQQIGALLGPVGALFGPLGPLVCIFELLAQPLDRVLKRAYLWIARSVCQLGISHAGRAIANRDRCHEMVPLRAPGRGADTVTAGEAAGRLYAGRDPVASQTVGGPPSITRRAGWMAASGTLKATTGWVR